MTTTALAQTRQKNKHWTRAEYHRVSDMGLLEDDRYELINGEIRHMPARGARHLSAQYRMSEALTDALRAHGLLVWPEYPVAIATDGEPVPDVVVAYGPVSRHDGRRAVRPEDVLFIVEVGASSVKADREEKGRLYAGALIPAYWLLNLEDDLLEVRSDPKPGGWVTENIYRPGDRPTLTVGGVAFTLDVAGVIPARFGGAEEG